MSAKNFVSYGDAETVLTGFANAIKSKANISDLGTAAAKNSTNAVTSGSTDLVESGAVKDAIDAAVSSAYHHAGTKTVAQLTHDLLVAANEGNVYNITDSGTTTSDFVEGIGKTINAGDNVGICKVGNDYMFDLLSGFVDTSNFVQKSQTAGLLENDGTVNTTIENTVAGHTTAIDEINSNIDSFMVEVTTGSILDFALTLPAKKTTYISVGTGVTDTPMANSYYVGAVIRSKISNNQLAVILVKPDNTGIYFHSFYGTWRSSWLDIGTYQKKTDNNLQTTDKTVVGGINELKSGLTNLGSEVDLNTNDLTTPSRTKNVLPMMLESMKSTNNTGTWNGNVYTRNGVDFTVNTDADGKVVSITINGTASEVTYFYLANNLQYLGTFDGSYTVNGAAAGGGENSYGLQVYSETSGILVNCYEPNDYIIEHSTYRNSAITSAIIVVRSGVTVNNLVFTPMIRLSSVSDPTFAPYIPSVETRLEAVESGLDDVNSNFASLKYAKIVDFYSTADGSKNLVLHFSGTAYTRYAHYLMSISGQSSIAKSIQVGFTGAAGTLETITGVITDDITGSGVSVSGTDIIIDCSIGGGWGHVGLLDVINNKNENITITAELVDK